MLQNTFILIPLITFLLGVIVLLRNPRDRVNLLFVLMTSSMSFWMVCNFMVDAVLEIGNAGFWAKLDFTMAPLMVYFFLIFCMDFPKPHKWKWFIHLLLAVPTVCFIIFALFTDYIIAGVIFTNGGFDVQYGSLELLYDIFIISYVGIGVFASYKNFKQTTGRERDQISLLFVGLIVLAIVVTIANLFGSYLFPDLPTINRLGFVGFTIFISFIAFSIIKKQLFDIKVILTETASGLVILALLSQIILSTNTSQRLISGIILIIVCYGAYLLIKSVQDEIKKKEKLQELTMQLGQANSHLQELDKMKTEFVSLASHELLTPVSAIEGYLSMLLDEKLAKVDDPTAVKYLDNVYKSAKRLARLVSDLLNISRIEEGRLLVEKQDVNLSDIIKQTIDEIHFKAEEHKQKIVFDNFSNQTSDHSIQQKAEARSPKADGFATYGDSDKIKEVLVNLIGNSIKYSKDPGTITVSIEKVPTAQINETWTKIEAEIKARPLDDQEAIKSAVDEHLRGLVGDEQLLISVKDQGIGIPKDELPRLFKKFHRVGDFTTAESQGTGLGLYISRALVELNHGRIWADSEGQGKGSTFSFSLPLLAQKQAILDLEAQAPKPEEQLKPLARPNKAAEEI